MLTLATKSLFQEKSEVTGNGIYAVPRECLFEAFEEVRLLTHHLDSPVTFPVEVSDFGFRLNSLIHGKRTRKWLYRCASIQKSSV